MHAYQAIFKSEFVIHCHEKFDLSILYLRSHKSFFSQRGAVVLDA